MAGAFRDDLEAARSRAEALDELNQELREELARLRRLPSAKREAERAPDSMTARTLERLARMTEEIELAPREETTAAVDPESPPRAPPRPALADETRVTIDVVQPILAPPQLEAVDQRSELAEPRRQLSSARVWMAVAFALGLVVGALLAGALR